MKKIRRAIIAVILIAGMLLPVIPAKAYTEKYPLSANVADISLGRVSRGTVPDYQEICIHNNTSEGVNIMWQHSDPEDFLMIDSPYDTYIPANGDTYFYVSADTNKPVGQYYGTIHFALVDDPGYEYGVDVDVSCLIVKPEPYIDSVYVNPSSARLSRDSSIQFEAIVEGGNEYSDAVSWTVEGATSRNTTISNSGVLHVGADEQSAALSITAISRQDSSKYASAYVQINNDSYNCNIYVQANPSSGGKASGSGTVTCGSSITVNASPAAGYSFVNWTLNGNQVSTSAKYTMDNVTKDGTLVANFKKNTCYIRVLTNHSYGGNVSGDVTVSAGDNTTISASPNPGYRFDGWVENGKTISTSQTYSLTNVQSDHTITANFSQTDYSVTVDANPYGAGTVTGNGKYAAGKNVTLTASPAAGYEFSSWVMNGNVIGREKTLYINNINQDYRIVAYFKLPEAKTFDITAGVTSNNGTISPTGKYSFPQGASVMYMISPKAGYVIAGVNVDGVNIGAVNSYTFSDLNGNHTITAAFALQPQPQTSEKPNPSPSASTEPTSTKLSEEEKYYENDGFKVENGVNLVNEEVDNVYVPSEENANWNNGVLGQRGITDEEALMLIKNKQADSLFVQAMENGTFDVSIYNELGPIQQMYATSYLNDRSVPNFPAVIGEIMSEDELLKVLQGEKYQISLNIYNCKDTISTQDKDAIDKFVDHNMTVSQYFDVVLVKASLNGTMTYSELNNPMTIVIDIPEVAKKEGRQFSVVRCHDAGLARTVEVLKDEDDNEDTITFSTDKFSSYAIVYTDKAATEDISTKKFIEFGIVAIVSLLGISIIAYAIFDAIEKRKNK